MPLTPFVWLLGGELLLSDQGLPPIELLLRLLPWGNPRPFVGKRLEQRVEAQCVLVSSRSVQCSYLDKEHSVAWVERSV